MSQGVYNPYEKYGLRRVINAAAPLTRIGGSILHPQILEAMEDASKCFVHIPELQQWAGKIIAEVTGAEAGLPTAGASNGIMLAAAACIMRGTELEKYDPLEQETWTHIIQRLPMHTSGLKTEFIVQKTNRNLYDHAVECAGGCLVEVGTEQGATEKHLHEAYNPEKTAAYYYTVHPAHKKCLPLKKVVKVAHDHNVPVIVDAALAVPPKKNLRKYIEEGADLVVFSGGKGIGGPNNSGFIAGKRDLIKLAHLQAYPFHGIGRAAKMSKETIVGLITALKIFLQRDEKTLFETWEKKAIWIKEHLSNIEGLNVTLTYLTDENNEPIAPLISIELNKKILGIDGKTLSDELRRGDPSIEAPYEPFYLLESCKGKLIINPQYLLEGDEIIIIRKIIEILKYRAKRACS